MMVKLPLRSANSIPDSIDAENAHERIDPLRLTISITFSVATKIYK